MLLPIVDGFDQKSAKRMTSIMGWIAFAKRPLRKAELRCALALGQGDPSVGELSPEYVLDLCAPLIEEYPDTTFSFVHGSVKE